MIRLLPKLLLYLLVIGSGVQLHGQSDQIEELPQRQISLSGAAQGGFVIAHRDQMRHLITGHTRGITLSAEVELNGTKYWHQAFQFPALGFEFFAADLGNPSQMGAGLSAMSYILLPLNQSENFRFYLKPGIGIGYVTKVYDPESNPKNFAMGSRINGTVMLESGCEIRLSERLKIVPGVRLTHFSNASYQKPNLGYNIPSVFLSAKWTARQGNRITEPRAKVEPPSLLFSVFGGFGIKENFPPGSGKRMTYTLNNLLEKRISFKSSLALGLDVFYNGGIEDPEAENGELTPVNKKVQIGMAGGYSLHLHKFRILVQAGIYLVDHFNRNGNIYNRFGLRYKINERLEAGLHLKTHITVADHFELGLGYRF